MSDYERYCRPKLARMLRALRLDITYQRASGMEMFDAEGRAVLDFVGGFGTLLLGHNPEPICRALVDTLAQQRVVHGQAAISDTCGQLARKLSEQMTGTRSYRVNFSNSGAESIEAALKHAYKRYAAGIQAKHAAAIRAGDELVRKLTRTGKLTLERRDAIEDMRSRNDEMLERLLGAPAIIALGGSFHGKLTSSLKVTSNPSFREDFAALSSLKSIFLPESQVEQLGRVLASETHEFMCPLLRAGEVSAHPVPARGVLALILEVIQGEGGVRELSTATLTFLADVHAKHELPYILDEVQTGCGRLGSFYGHKLTPLASIEPEYVALSKALGGGLVKIGATLIREDIYDEDFGIQHTSTFGEDGLAASVALATVEALAADNGWILQEVTRRGGELKRALQELADAYPGIVREVRGRGLMLGIELCQLPDASPFLRAASESGALPLIIASFALHYHNLRLFCPLNSLLAHGRPGIASVLRIQPSYLLEPTHIRSLIRCLNEAFEAIARNNEFVLLGHLYGQPATPGQRANPDRFVAHLPRNRSGKRPDAISAFIAHATSVEMLIESFMPSLQEAGADPVAVERWWEEVAEFIEPTLVRSEYIEIAGKVLRTDIVLIPYLPAHIERLKRWKQSAQVSDKVEDAIELSIATAKEEHLPLSSVGLGGYTSIVSHNGEDLQARGFPVTTGNAFTTALVMEGVNRLVESKHLRWNDLTLSIVGAAGNIGSVLTSFYALRCPRLRLIGRTGRDSESRLQLVLRNGLRELIDRAVDPAQEDPEHGVLTQLRSAAELAPGGGPADILRRAMALVRADSPLEARQLDELRIALAALGILQVDLSLDLQTIATCDVVIVATDSADPELVTPEMVKPGAILCCASVPTNLSRAFLGNTRCVAFDGGLARIPSGTTIDYPGFPSDGLTYGCHAESMIAALEREGSFRSIGVLTASDITNAWSLGRKHGFELGQLRLHNHNLNLAK